MKTKEEKLIEVFRKHATSSNEGELINVYLTKQLIDDIIACQEQQPAPQDKEESDAIFDNKQFYEYGQSLGIKINDLQRLMFLAKRTQDKDSELVEFAEWLIRERVLGAIIDGIVKHVMPPYIPATEITTTELLTIFKNRNK